MFHYRNHGSAFGRVLVGLQVNKQDRAELKEFLDTIWDTDMPMKLIIQPISSF